MSNEDKAFPFDYSDKEIKNEVKPYSNQLKNASINAVLRNSPFVQVGMNELQDRQSKRMGRISMGIALIAIIISVLSFISSNNWKKEQIKILNRIEQLAEETIQ